MSTVWRTVWRGMLARKLRLALSALAVVLGVSFVTGSQIFSQTLGEHLTGTVAGHVPDVVVQPDEAGQTPARVSPAAIDDDLVAAVAALPEVGRAVGEVRVEGVIVLDADGDPLSTIGAATLGLNHHDLPADDGGVGMTLTQGRAPSGSGEVALDPATVERGGFTLGQEVTVVTPVDGPRPFTLTGSLDSGIPLAGGSTITIMDTATAQQTLTGQAGRFHRIGVVPAAGSSAEEAAGAVAAMLPAGLEAATGTAVTEDAIEGMSGALATMSLLLYGFAAVSVVVGGFLIVNTFSMLVQQRRQEIALLRSIGARARQVRRLVLGEAALLGAAASAVGSVVGIGLAAVLVRLFSVIGADVSAMGLVITAPALLTGFVVGVLTTVLAAWIPVRSTAGIAPVEALRTAAVAPARQRGRDVLGVLVLVLGATALGLVIARVSPDAAVVGLGLLLTLVGVVLLAPHLVRPVSGGLGALLRRTHGPVGTLARRNAERNPRRTGATVAALVVGLALVSAMSVVAHSVRSSVAHQLDDSFAADLVIATPHNAVLPAPLLEQVAATDGVELVSGAATLPVEVDGELMTVAVEDAPATITAVDVVEGRLADLDATHVAVDDARAEQLGVGVGDRVVLTSNGQDLDVTVAAVYREMPSLVAPWLADKATAEAFGWPAQDIMVGVLLEPGADLATVRAELEAELDPYPLVGAFDGAEFTQLRTVEVNQVVGLVYVLLALTVLVALLGVVNTLALSVVERQREIGMLRAVGLRRGGVRQLVRLESAIICVAGALLGVATGTAAGAAVHRTVEESGIAVLDVPWATLAAFVVVTTLVGLLAAVLPARMASRTDVLDAIATT